MPQPLHRPEDPMAGHLTALYDRVARLERRPIASGGFDPNEDPVIIGSGATAGGGSTPSSVAAGFVGSVAIGEGATVSAIQTVAIGKGSFAEKDGCIAIGYSAIADGDTFAIAIGEGALADHYAGIAIGHSAHGKLSGIAIGEAAHAFDTVSGHQVALGDNAVGASGAPYSVAVGYQASVSGTGSVAVGHNAVVSAGIASAVVVGDGATCGGAEGIAIGNAATVGVATSGIAIGNGADATGASATAVGPAANAAAHAVAVGQTTSAAAASVAIGQGATASTLRATALGQGAATTKDDQIMLGTIGTFTEIPQNAASGLVMSDLTTGTRYLIQVNSGALVLSLAP